MDVELWSKWNKEANKQNKDRIPGSKKNPIKAISSKKIIWGKFAPIDIYDKNLKNLAKRTNLAEKNQRWLNATRVKQVLPTVGRAIGIGSGWGALITGVSLLAQTKKAKQFRQDPTYRKAAIKKLFKVRN